MRIKFIQNLIDKLRNKNEKIISKFLRENTLSLPENFDKSKLHIAIDGKNNSIIIGRSVNISSKLSICGYVDDSVIEIGENFSCGNVHFQLGQNHKNFGKIQNTKIKIGSDVSWETGKYVTYNSNTYLKIGNDCMFAGDVTLYNTDAHPILNNDTKEVINKVKGIKIGNHVWLGMGVTVLKNSTVPENSVVGWGSVYSGSGGGGKSLSNCAFAGNPARCVKGNIDWDKNGAKFGYIENNLCIKQKSKELNNK